MLLVAEANRTQSYQKAIDMIQTWLVQFVANGHIHEKQLIEDIANDAGKLFLREIRRVQMQEKMKRGEFPINISVSRN